MALRKATDDEIGDRLSAVLFEAAKENGYPPEEVMEAATMFAAVLAIAEGVGLVLALDGVEHEQPEQG